MKYIRRLLWFIASRMIILSACVAILICAFYMALNSGNIYILVTDGMAKRVEVALTREAANELNKYFSADFLNNDPVMQIAFSANSPYIDYNITDFDHVITLEWLWAWPWQDTAYCTITERVPSIEGSVISSRVTDVRGDPPAWRIRGYAHEERRTMAHRGPDANARELGADARAFGDARAGGWQCAGMTYR